ncbi:MAG: hypothetical protein JWM80_5918 [Cyanobacteria bacterium RYN_339]|nr:hypothetical protein [Cyanobacteria bacterium RYN_339]
MMALTVAACQGRATKLVAPEVKPAARVTAQPFAVAAPPTANAGSLSITVRGPAEGLLAREGAAIVANNAGNLVSNHSAGVISNQGARLRLFALDDLTTPIAGTTPVLVDAKGVELARADGPTGADGLATFSKLPSTAALFFIRARYERNGMAVELVALVPAPRDGGRQDAQVDPATSLVAKQLATQTLAAPGLLDSLDPAGIARAVAAAGAAMDARTVVAAALLDDKAAAATYADLQARVPEVAKAVPPSPTPPPEPAGTPAATATTTATPGASPSKGTAATPTPVPTAAPVGATPTPTPLSATPTPTPGGATPTPAPTATPAPPAGTTAAVQALIVQGNAQAAAGHGTQAASFYHDAADIIVTVDDGLAVARAAATYGQTSSRAYATTAALVKASTTTLSLQVGNYAATIGDGTNADAAYHQAADQGQNTTACLDVARAAATAGRTTSRGYAVSAALAKANTSALSLTVANYAASVGDGTHASAGFHQAADQAATSDDCLDVARAANTAGQISSRQYAEDTGLGKATDWQASLRVATYAANQGDGSHASTAFRQSADQCTTKANAQSVAAAATTAGQSSAATYANSVAAGLP